MRYVIAILLVTISISFLNAEEPTAHELYLSVDWTKAPGLGLGTSMNFPIGASLPYEGTFFIVDSSAHIFQGISRGLATMRDYVRVSPDGAAYAFVFSFDLRQEKAGNRLNGAIYEMRFDKDQALGQVKTTVVDTSIDIDIPVTLPVGELFGGHSLVTQITALRDMSVVVPPSQKKPPILLISRLKFGGKFAGVGGFGASIPGTYDVDFPLSALMLKSRNLRYKVEVDLPGLDKNLNATTPTKLTYSRHYAIITRSDKDDTKSLITNYTSHYQKDLILEPGKEIHVIIPPDTPSVGGFDIEDSLTIVPR